MLPARSAESAIPTGPAKRSEDLPEPEAVLATVSRLAAARRVARQHARRLRGGEAWAEPEAAAFEELAWSVPGVPGRNSIAQAVGTAIHRAMAELDLSADPQDELKRLKPGLVEHLRPLLRAEEVRPAQQRADGVLYRVLNGPWPARLSALVGAIKARALPVLLPPPPGADAPTGFLAGEIDLLVADPQSGSLLVIDFKTEDIPAAEVPERAAHYRVQGMAYCQAVAAALGLEQPPELELWFLLPGIVIRPGRP